MNINRDKLIKSALTILAVFVVVGVLTHLSGQNSKTLSDYAAENPQLAYQNTTGSDISENEKEENMTDEQADEVSAALQETEELTVSSFPLLTGAALNKDNMSEERITYKDYFYYEPLSDDLCRYITGISYPAAEPLEITFDELRYVHILHYNFDKAVTCCELICNQAIAQDLVEIFYELYLNEYQLEKVLLIDTYNGDDTASMEDNNSSCFNYRQVSGSSTLSKHALGLAIDINPLYNPYITYNSDGSEQTAPVSAAPYADRSSSFPYKIDENDLCYKLFTQHGFTWGGNWNSCKDYQHFQKAVY